MTVEFLPTGEREVLSADILVHATGYRPRDVGDTSGRSANSACATRRTPAGRPRLPGRHRPRGHRGIYLQGGTEHTHGITSTLLSTTAVRAGEICASLLARRATDLTTTEA